MLMRWMVDLCYLLAAVLLAPFLLYRSIRTGKYRRDWDQRRGWLPELPGGRLRVWIHAVSMGEVNALPGLVAAWQWRAPDTELVISSTTDTGIDRARKLFPDLVVFRYPLDFSRFVNRALDRIAPTLIVLVELEVWYQLVTLATSRGIPVAVINGRITADKSLRRFRWVMPIARRMFGALAWVGAQDESYAERFRMVGVRPDRISVTGSMKWDTAQIVDSVPGSEELARAVGLDRGRPVWVCGSTAEGEEAIVLRVFASLRCKYPTLQLVIVPRRPERFDEVAGLIGQAGFTCVRRSMSPDGSHSAPSGTEVVLGDTMGELRKFYCLADVVFVGRTLADAGGSDMIEVAALARPTIVGPHTENFADVVRRLEAARAIHVLSADLKDDGVTEALARAVNTLLADREAARRMGQAAREVVKQNLGATQRTLEALMEIMHRAQHRPS